MNALFDKLLSIDEGKINDQEQGVFHSKRLAKLFGEDKPVEIKIRALDYNRLNELLGKQFDRKGRVDMSKSGRVKAVLVSEGIISPDLKDERLLKKFHADTPADLAEKLFQMEIHEISDAICNLSGVFTDEDELEKEDDEIKNS